MAKNLEKCGPDLPARLGKEEFYARLKLLALLSEFAQRFEHITGFAGNSFSPGEVGANPRKVVSKQERGSTYPLNTPPVCFFTFSTIRPASASKSSSVSVRSAG